MSFNGSFSVLEQKQVVNVAVAVLAYGEYLLLAKRQAHQHQGDKWEFVGGKVEKGESAEQALVREVFEELGLDIGDNRRVKLGRIYHDYADKSVCLQVYQVWLDDRAYQVYKDKTQGCDGQAIGFYDRAWVVSQADKFPSANRPILHWLSLPSAVVISRSLSDFDSVADFVEAYASLPVGSTLYLRLQADFSKTKEVIKALSARRTDLAWILPMDFYSAYQSYLPDVNIVALKLPLDDAKQFLESFEYHQITPKTDTSFSLSQDVIAQYLQMSKKCADVFDFDKFFKLPWLLSCHDTDEINIANALAGYYPIWGVFVSPVLPTATHPDTPALGWQNFAHLADLSCVPVIALGGLTKQDMMMANAHGAVAVSGIRGFIAT